VPITVGVLDYGSGNLHSVSRALEAAGARVVLSADPMALRRTAGLVLPGVGAFAACMAGLQEVGGADLVRDWVAHGRPLLGICVGHQVLFDRGVEHGVETAGLGLLPGTVDRLNAQRLPHMGWNEVSPPPGSTLFSGVADQRFYFVHSYAAHACPEPRAAVTWTQHEEDRFISAIEAGPICATQFHPEKSGPAGGRLLANWLGTLS